MIALLSCNKKDDSDPNTPFKLSDKMLETTTFASAKFDSVKNELKFYGKITTDNNKYIEIYPAVGGNVTGVFVEQGDFVKKGQLLATIKSTEVAGFEKDLDDAKNDVIVAKNNLKVTQEMFEGKLSTERDLLEAKNQLEKAQTQLQRTEEIYKIYSLKKGAIYEVRSPLTGFIIEKKINTDMLLRSDKSDNIFDVAEINDVWAIANVNESEIAQVFLGIDASVTTLSYPDKVFYGKVDKIYNIIDPDTKAMKVRIRLKNQDYLLKPEMRANIKLTFTENKMMLSIPSSAIIFDKSKYFVMVYKDRSDIETRQVEVYRQVGDIAYISSGLNPGEKVMTTNQLMIYDSLND